MSGMWRLSCRRNHQASLQVTPYKTRSSLPHLTVMVLMARYIMYIRVLRAEVSAESFFIQRSFLERVPIYHDTIVSPIKES